MANPNRSRTRETTGVLSNIVHVRTYETSSRCGKGHKVSGHGYSEKQSNQNWQKNGKKHKH